MAITRLWQAGWEMQNEALELTSENVSLSSTTYKTGSRALAINTAASTTYQEITSAIAQCRIGLHFYQIGTSGAGGVDIVTLRNNTTSIVRVQYDTYTGEWKVLCGATTVATVSDPAMNVRSTWCHIGVDVLIDGAAGWVQVYRDGTKVVDFSGDTNDGGANFNRLYFGMTSASPQWTGGTCVDDCYWDDTTGEGAGAAPPDLRFPLIVPNGNGNYADWTGSDGNSVDNYALVDELPPSATDYVSAASAGLNDSYALADYTPTPGATVAAVIPLCRALKDAAGTTLQLKIATRAGGSDGSGTAQALGTGYATIWERYTTKPAGGAWAEADVDGAEVLLTSA